MAKLKWDQVGQRFYETGTSKGVLFTQTSTGTYNAGVAWSGLVSIKKSPDGAESNALYADNMKYLELTSLENLKGSIDAFTYPDEFEACDGSKEVHPGVFVGQQNRVPFGLAWLTVKGNDTQGNAFGEKLHIVYNAKVAPSERAYETVNEDPEAITFSWEFSTTPNDLSDIGLEASAGIVIDKSQVTAANWKELTDNIFGRDEKKDSTGAITEAAIISNLLSIQKIVDICSA